MLKDSEIKTMTFQSETSTDFCRDNFISNNYLIDNNSLFYFYTNEPYQYGIREQVHFPSEEAVNFSDQPVLPGKQYPFEDE